MGNPEYIEWLGGEICPLAEGTIVSVVFRGAPDLPSRPMMVNFLPASLWQHIGSGLDVVGYRIVEAPSAKTLN